MIHVHIILVFNVVENFKSQILLLQAAKNFKVEGLNTPFLEKCRIQKDDQLLHRFIVFNVVESEFTTGTFKNTFMVNFQKIQPVFVFEVTKFGCFRGRKITGVRHRFAKVPLGQFALLREAFLGLAGHVGHFRPRSLVALTGTYKNDDSGDSDHSQT